MINNDDITVLIPAAGTLKEDLLPLSGNLSPSMISVDGKPLIYRVIKYLQECNLKRFVLGIRKGDNQLKDFVSRVFDKELDISFKEINIDRGVGYTIWRCSQDYDIKKAIIVLGDTFFRFPDLFTAQSNGSFILYSRVNESYRWCLSEFNREGRLEKLIDKPMQYEGEKNALIGVYGIDNFPSFFEGAKKVIDSSAEDSNIEISTILNEYIKTNIVQCFRCEEWFDCGHPDNLLISRKKLIQEREFNQVIFDEKFGKITKTSTHKEKFVDEINYYALLPKPLNIFFPRILQADPHCKRPFIEMEYYGYPPLAELYVQSGLNPSIWKQLFEKLRDVIDEFKFYNNSVATNKYFDFYVIRSEKRIKSLRERDSEVAKLFKFENIELNGERLDNFDSIWPTIKSKLISMCSYDNEYIIHGDFCFSNILYDVKSRIFKFIDPRGSFGTAGVYGDTRYDIAKLYHSIHGLYDFITADLFRLNIENEKINFEIFSSSNTDEIQKVFREIFFLEYDEEEIILIEGLLFMTMGIFHSDKPERQIAMYLTGLRIWNELLQKG